MWEKKLMERVAQVLSYKSGWLRPCCQYYGNATHDCCLDNWPTEDPPENKNDNNPRPLIPLPAQLLHDNHRTGVVSTFKNLRTANPILNTFRRRKKPLEEAPPETSTANEESTPKKKAKYNKTKNSSRKLRPPPVAEAQLPEAFKNRILEMGGLLDELMLVLKKELYNTDVKRDQGRLSLPYGQANMNFLTSNERYNLDQPKAEIQGTLIEPCLHECTISLRDWKTNSVMALVNPWNEVCVRNELKQGSVVQLWSFKRNSRLCFVLVLVD